MCSVSLRDLLYHPPALFTQPLVWPGFVQAGWQVEVLPLAQVHPTVGGNKYFKLRPTLLRALEAQEPPSHFVSVGGAFSNHLYALAAAGHELGISTMGLVRGEPVSNPMLAQMLAWGMELHFVSRSDFRDKLALQAQFQALYPSAWWIPEGGSSPDSLLSVADIPRLCPSQADVWAVACGTGATWAGLALGTSALVYGLATLKNADWLWEETAELCHAAGISPPRNRMLETRYPHGGYAKTSPELRAFCAEFQQATGWALDEVYTGKLLYGLNQAAQERIWPAGTRICVVLTHPENRLEK